MHAGWLSGHCAHLLDRHVSAGSARCGLPTSPLALCLRPHLSHSPLRPKRSIAYPPTRPLAQPHRPPIRPHPPLRPKRSSSWGRSSPSAGLPLPIMMNLAGCTMEMPSRSTVFWPPAAARESRGQQIKQQAAGEEMCAMELCHGRPFNGHAEQLQQQQHIQVV